MVVDKIEVNAPSGRKYIVSIEDGSYECPLTDEVASEVGSANGYWDALVISFERGHNGMEGYTNHNFESPDEAEGWAKQNDYKVLPLYKYEHGMVAFSTRSFAGRAHHADWDSGQIGFIFYKDTGDAGVRADILEGLMERYSDWCNGDAYEVVVRDGDGYVGTIYGPVYGSEADGMAGLWEVFADRADEGDFDSDEMSDEDYAAVMETMRNPRGC